MKSFTDEELMNEVAKDNLEYLRLLFEKHHKHVYNFLYKMSRDKDLSEDITQEVFYKILKYRKTYNNGKFLPWLFSITRNSLSNHFKRKKIAYASIEDEHHNLYLYEETKQDDYSKLHKALDRLDPSEKEILILKKIQNLKYKELAEILESTPGAAKTKVSRALKKLKEIYFNNYNNE